MHFQGISEQFGTLCFSGRQPVSSHASWGDSSHSQFSNEHTRAPSIPWHQRTKQMDATGSLDFVTHTFPLMATIKRGTLEEAFTAEEIYRFGEVPANDVNQYLRQLVAQIQSTAVVQLKAPAEVEINIDSKLATEEKRYCYECSVEYPQQLSFQVSAQQEPYQLIQKAYGPDKVLKVTFGEDQSPTHDTYRRLLETGIFIGLRRYQYWVHRESDKKKTKLKENESSSSVKCFFVCTDSLAATDLCESTTFFKFFKSISECRRHIMDIHTTESIAKYHSRLLLALSRTVTVEVGFDLQVVEDMHCKDAAGHDLDVICTDGTGFISSDLAKVFPMNITKGVAQQTSEYDSREVCPGLFQIRIFRHGCAIKGTLAVDHRLPLRTIVCRESMVKVWPDARSPDAAQVSTIELCNTRLLVSCPSLGSVSTLYSGTPFAAIPPVKVGKTPHTGKLSRDLILISTVLGVPASFFLGAVQRAIDIVKQKVYDTAAAFLAIRAMTTDEADLAHRMILAGIPVEEPFLHQSLKRLTGGGWEDIKMGRVELPDSYNLMGTADPTGTLQRNQVAITLSHGPIIYPRVAVYRTPGKHPGDVHIFETTWNRELQMAVGNAKYAIYFSTQGTRPVYEEIGNGDLDGDRYWICTDTNYLLHLREYHVRYVPRKIPPSIADRVKPADFPQDELQKRLINMFLEARFHSRPFVGQAANYWTVHMDRFLMLDRSHEQERQMHWKKAEEAGHLFNEAVNSGKSGLQIDSQKLSGLRPLQVPHYHVKTLTKKVEGYGKHIPVDKGNIYHSTSILGQIFDLATQAEIDWLSGPAAIELDRQFQFPNFAKHCQKWSDHYATYRMEMAKVLARQKPPGWSNRPTEDDVILKYKRILFRAGFSQDEKTRVLEESSAIYCVVYSKAQIDISNGRVPRLSFAWKVAGLKLMDIYRESTEVRRDGNGVPLPSYEPFLERQPRVTCGVSYPALNTVILRRQSY